MFCYLDQTLYSALCNFKTLIKINCDKGVSHQLLMKLRDYSCFLTPAFKNCSTVGVKQYNRALYMFKKEFHKYLL